MREVKLKLNPAKWVFKTKKVMFIGFQLSPDGVSPSPSMAEAITEMPKSSDQQAVQRYLGMLNFLARFRPRLSEVVKPLRDLTHKDVFFKWTDAHDKAFADSKKPHRPCPCLAVLQLSIACYCCTIYQSLGGALLQDFLMEKPFPPRAESCLWRRCLKCNIPLLKSSFKIPGRKGTLRMAKTKIETSGKLLRISLLPGCNDMFFVGGTTKPAMKQAKGITSGSGVYSCIVVFNGKILAARDRSCAAGKDGFCKHIAALCYKLVELKLSSARKLPQSLSPTEIRQQWEIPSLRAQQVPEKDVTKKKTLHGIKFEEHVLTHDQAGGRNRKVPQEVNGSYTLKPAGEPATDTAHVEAFKRTWQIPRVPSESPTAVSLLSHTDIIRQREYALHLNWY